MTKTSTFTTPADDQLLTLDALAAALPKPDAALQAALIAEESQAEYTKIGTEIKTARVVTDARRLYAVAYAFWTQASDAQKDKLVGFSEDLLAIGVAHAQKLAAMDASATTKSQARAAAQKAHDDTSADATRAAVALRDQAVNVLSRIAGTDQKLRALVHAADVGAATPANLASSLRALAQAGTTLLGQKKDVALRIKANRLTKSFLASLDSAADAVDASDTLVAGAGRSVTQGALDYNDGVQLHLLEHVLDAFEKAHDVDATIPRLVPIATRRLLGGAHHAKKTTASAPAGAGAPSPGAGASPAGADGSSAGAGGSSAGAGGT